MVVNIQNVVFCIVTACNFLACTDASKENAVCRHNSEDGGSYFLRNTDNNLQGCAVLQPKMLQFGLSSL
jgi:hypothetical protein